MKDNHQGGKVIVTGAAGQLGQELERATHAHPLFEFIFLTRDSLDITEAALVRKFFDSAEPAFCINCAAYTAVDKAESEKEKAFRVNTQAVGVLAQTCHQSGTRMIHISTDYVFDGNSPVPLTEEDPVAPVNVYGETKLEGERLAFAFNPQTIVIRTSWVYSEYGNNFVKTMLRLMKEKPAISVVDDQLGSPTYAADLADAILHILESGKFAPGIYNYSNEGKISWHEFALGIKTFTSSPCVINPIATAGYPTPARRPHFSLLDKGKIKKVYGVEIIDWEKSLAACLERIFAK